jgi:hypothetical protein
MPSVLGPLARKLLSAIDGRTARASIFGKGSEREVIMLSMYALMHSTSCEEL